MLHLPDFIAGTSDLKIVARPGGRNSGDDLTRIDENGISIVISEDFDWCVTTVAERFRTPLAHPVRTTDILSVTVLREDRLNDIRPGEVIAENFINDSGDAFEDVAVWNPFVVESG